MFPTAPLITTLETATASLCGRPESKLTEDGTVTPALRVDAITANGSMELRYTCYEKSQMLYVSDWLVVYWACRPRVFSCFLLSLTPFPVKLVSRNL